MKPIRTLTKELALLKVDRDFEAQSPLANAKRLNDYDAEIAEVTEAIRILSAEKPDGYDLDVIFEAFRTFEPQMTKMGVKERLEYFIKQRKTKQDEK